MGYDFLVRTVGVAGFGAGAGEHDFSTPLSAPISTPTSIMASGETLTPMSRISFLRGAHGLISPMPEMQEALGYVPSQVLLARAHAHGTCSTLTSSVSALPCSFELLGVCFVSMDVWKVLCGCQCKLELVPSYVMIAVAPPS